MMNLLCGCQCRKLKDTHYINKNKTARRGTVGQDGSYCVFQNYSYICTIMSCRFGGKIIIIGISDPTEMPFIVLKGADGVKLDIIANRQTKTARRGTVGLKKNESKAYSAFIPKRIARRLVLVVTVTTVSAAKSFTISYLSESVTVSVKGELPVAPVLPAIVWVATDDPPIWKSRVGVFPVQPTA
jgi:hypothetical protein